LVKDSIWFTEDEEINIDFEFVTRGVNFLFEFFFKYFKIALRSLKQIDWG
jgi:hypothetical protein